MTGLDPIDGNGGAELDPPEPVAQRTGARVWRAFGSIETRETSGTIAASFVGQLAQVASGVITARLLGPTFRGELALLTMVPAVAAQVGHLGVPSAVVFFTARDPNRHASILQSGLRAVLPPAAVLGIGSAVAVGLIGTPASDALVVLGMTAAIVPAYIFQLVALGSLQGRRLFTPYNVQRVLPLVLNAAGLGLLLILRLTSVLLALVVLFVAQVFGTALSLAFARASRKATEPHVHPLLLRFGLKGLPATLSPVETFRVDQFIVGIALGITALGFYAAGTAFAVLPRLVAQAIATAAYPSVVSSPSRAGMARTALAFILTTIVIVGAITLALESVLSALTIQFFGEAFLPAVAVGRILVLAAAFMSFRRVIAECTRAMGRPDLDSISEIAIWPVLAVGLATLTPTLGAIGVAWSLVVSYGVGTLVAAGLFAYAVSRGVVPAAAEG